MQHLDQRLAGAVGVRGAHAGKARIQGERAGNTLGSEELRNFLGTMSRKVDRGGFLTTSTFTQAAERELEGRAVRVVLIKGEGLVDLMIDHGVGVEPIKVATIHRINEDFFDEL